MDLREREKRDGEKDREKERERERERGRERSKIIKQDKLCTPNITQNKNGPRKNDTHKKVTHLREDIVKNINVALFFASPNYFSFVMSFLLLFFSN